MVDTGYWILDTGKEQIFVFLLHLFWFNLWNYIFWLLYIDLFDLYYAWLVLHCFICPVCDWSSDETGPKTNICFYVLGTCVGGSNIAFLVIISSFILSMQFFFLLLLVFEYSMTVAMLPWLVLTKLFSIWLDNWSPLFSLSSRFELILLLVLLSLNNGIKVE